FVQFLVVSDRKLQVTGDDPGLLVVAGRVASQFQYLSGEVFHDRGQINRSTSADSLGVVSLPQQSVNPAHGELQSRPVRARLRLSLNFAAFAASRHLRSINTETLTVREARELWQPSNGAVLLYATRVARRHQ
ncbi:hypothetical protein X777_15629, partial [Ooceraea biroi]